MAKKSDRMITSVYLTKEMCSEIDKMAARENVSRNEQIRRFIEKGLDIEPQKMKWNDNRRCL